MLFGWFSVWCSDSEWESTSGEALLGHSVLVNGLGFHPVLGLSLHLLTSLLLIVLPLHLLELTSKTLNFILVLIDLSLVHVELGSHGFHLISLLLQILLVDRQLFGNLRAWLSGEQVLKLKIKLFLLLDGNIFLDDFLSLLDESLLEGLDLLDQLVSIWVSALDSSPPVVVEWILQLFTESLHLETLLLELVSEAAHLCLVLDYLSGLALLNLEFTLQLGDLVLEQLYVLETLSVLHFSLAESDLENLDLFVEKSQFVVSPNELGS